MSTEKEDREQPVAWGMPNSAITGREHPLMMVRLEIPSDDQYGGAMWIPLYTHPLAQAATDKVDARRYRWFRLNCNPDDCGTDDREETARELDIRIDEGMIREELLANVNQIALTGTKP